VSTERRNPRSVDIDLFPTERVLKIINAEDALVANAVGTAIPDIAKLVEMGVQSIRAGGHVIYVGAGTSGRIAMTDAAEVPPTFSAPSDWVQAVMAGGAKAFSKATEGSEDDREKTAADLKSKKITKHDLVIGIAATGSTPYTLAALELAKDKGAKTAAVVCTENSPMSKAADVTIYVPVGAEVITGSTRMKAGTAQKLVLNMISTSVMILIGRVEGNRMVNMQLTNSKLIERGTQMVMMKTGISDHEKARQLLLRYGSVKKAVESTYQ